MKTTVFHVQSVFQVTMAFNALNLIDKVYLPFKQFEQSIVSISFALSLKLASAQQSK